MKSRPIGIGTLVSGLLFIATAQLPAEESLLQDYIRTFEGRWVCETESDQDIEGYSKKGEAIRLVLFNIPLADGSGVRQEWQLEKDGEVRGKFHGIVAFDPSTNSIKIYGPATGGFHVEATRSKENGVWIGNGIVTHPDGSKATSKSKITVSADGKTYKVQLTNRIDHEGNKLEDKVNVWKRVSANHEELNKHLGWIIGDWQAELVIPGLGTTVAEASYTWIAHETVIRHELKIGEWENLSIVLFDPADGRIKMWGANSAGGNGQAVMRAEGNELIFTNTVYGPDGKKLVSEFSYVPAEDGQSFLVRYVDQQDGQEKKVKITRKK